MNKSDAITILKESFSHPTSTPHVGAADRDIYIEKSKYFLIEHVVDPLKVEAHTSQWVREFTDFTADSYFMTAIAKNENRELLYDENSKTFSLAIRNEQGKLYLVGYASTDALAEWLG